MFETQNNIKFSPIEPRKGADTPRYIREIIALLRGCNKPSENPFLSALYRGDISPFTEDHPI